jgi:hypothetical protein
MKASTLLGKSHRTMTKRTRSLAIAIAVLAASAVSLLPPQASARASAYPNVTILASWVED